MTFVVLLLFASLVAPEVAAQINGLSNTERQNVENALNNLEKLISDARKLLESRDIPNTPGNQQAIDQFNESLSNLREKYSSGDIKSVPDLDDDSKNKYRHGNERGSPKGAYCDENTYVKNNSGWDKCDPGDIILDKAILDPGSGTPINASTMGGWQAKWALVHILVHEKFHEIMINAQVQEVMKRPGWGSKTPAQQEQETERARERGSSAEAHAQVYAWQKNLLRLYKKVLQEERERLQRQDRRGNAAAIEELRQKIRWLEEEISRLESAMRKAVRGHDFGFDDCSWPGEPENGTVVLYITFPGGYWTLGLSLQNRMPVDHRLVETGFLDVLEQEEALQDPPSLLMTMTETTFSGIHIQPDQCAYIQWAGETGRIQVVDPTQLKDILPQSMRVVLTDGTTGDPLAGVTVDLFDSRGDHVQRVVTNETGVFTTLLPSDEYRVQVSKRILGFDISVYVQEVVNPKIVSELQVQVTVFIIPIAYLPLLVQSLLGLAFGSIGGVVTRYLRKGRWPRWVPPAVGVGIFSATMVPLALGWI